jgi:hypothetical protein
MASTINLIHQQGETHCAAACLEMVYRAVGVVRDQQAIFDEHSVVRPTNAQELYIRSHSIALDAQRNGLKALAFKPRDIIASLRTCVDNELFVILEQRTNLKRKSHIGHMRLCCRRAGQATFEVFDPHPSHRSPVEMTAHMIRQLSAENKPEIVGLIIAIGIKPFRIEQCAACGIEIPWEFNCQHCGQPIRLDMSALLGCPNTKCSNSVYLRVTCPECNSVPRPGAH